MKPQLLPRAAMAAMCLLATQPLSSAQGGCPTDTYTEAWVDPFYGGAGMVGDIDQPFTTLQGAIDAIDAVLPAGEEGLVHALPGLYAAGSNGEVFPIDMRTNIHVQGAGAKETVLRVRPTDPAIIVQWPLSTGVIQIEAQVIVNYSDVREETMMDGFTFQGACVQVYAETAHHPIEGRVSNCVFDMRDGGDEFLSGPFFGQLTASLVDGEVLPITFFTLNNTFIQGARFAGEETDLSLIESVAICDMSFGEAEGSSGLNDLHIQNNIIRCLDGALRTATLGIDLGDTAVIPGITPTNAFNAGLGVGVSIDPAMTFTSAIVGAAPIPAIDLGPLDPGFIGEHLSDTTGDRIRDYRLLPDSVCVDAGQVPAGDPCNPTLTAVNGVVYTDVLRADSAESSFDFDGEVHGNPRIEGVTIDIGFDEVGEFITAGHYGNDTKSHHLPYDAALGDEIPGVPLIPTGRADRVHYNDVPTFFAYLVNFAPIVLPLPGTSDWINADFFNPVGPWTYMRGAMQFPFPLTPTLDTWLDFSLGPVNAGSFMSTAAAWTNWESGQAHTFANFTWTVDETVLTLAPTFLNAQTANLTPGGVVTSNLQAEYQ